MRVAGIMSGTSLDGIDVAIVDITRSKIVPVAFRSRPYKPATRAAILAVSNANTHTAEISRLNFALGKLYADALIKSGVPLESIELIGCHGQTIFHESGDTMQIGESAVIAEHTGIPVVSNFRARDIAAGGLGAPLVPFFDYRMFRHPRRRRVALNLGGIANVTIIPANASLEQVTAFDTGPANMVMDQLVNDLTGGRENFDKGGRIGASGEPDIQLLGELMRDPYYRKKPPKSAGREQYGAEFIARLKQSGRSPTDLIATAALLTATTVAQAVGTEPGDLIASGGGVHNSYLMSHLHALLPNMRIATTREYGIDPDAKEAIAFALMAYETWHRRPSNVPSATGAKRAVILGEICYS